MIILFHNSVILSIIIYIYTYTFDRANQPQHDPFSIFEHFGFGGMGGGRHHQEEPHTASVEIPLRVSLRQLYVGEMLDVSYSRQVLCAEASSCQSNNKDCQGPGIKVRLQQLAPGFVQQVQVADASCVGRGKAWKPNCKACPKGMTEEEEIELTVDIKPGMADGETIKFDQIADEAVGHIAGDVIFTIKQAPHPLFKRSGDNLEMTITISLLDSLIGFRKTFQHLDGHEFIVEKKTVSYCSQVVTVNGEGMPRKGSRGSSAKGDLFVTLLIEFPSVLSEKQKALLHEAFA
jgi:DnaJ-class molecular chaperone